MQRSKFNQHNIIVAYAPNKGLIMVINGFAYRVNTFKYLGATLAENGDVDAEMTHGKTGSWYRGFCVTEE